MNNTLPKIAGAIAALALAVVPAASQSLTPMRGETRSVVETFAMRVVVGNPYDTRQAFEIKVYDDKFYPVVAQVSLPQVLLPPKGSRSVVVVVPFAGAATRKVRICAEGVFGTATSSKLRTQVCGRFLATHLG